MTLGRPNVQLGHFEARNEKRRFPVCILAHDVRTPTNVGSLFRIADAFGLEGVHLSGDSAVPPNAKIRKTARCAERHVPYTYTADPLEITARLKAEGYRIISLEITTASIDLRDFVVPPDAKLCVVVGSESTGVRQDLLDASDVTVHIPMFGENSSMNLATACAVASFEMVRQLAPHSDTGKP